jgi:transcriptional regulator with PAS, ATPase and Fis domain
LILGETGTGKELVAKALHSESLLADRPFVTVNCAALPENLLESELFGHVRGAFTGAFYAKKGVLVEADGGTIFLDEIAEMPPSTQSKLLRFLESGEVKPLGDNRTVKVNVRGLAATNQELEQALKSKQFREDLYYRLNVLQIELPPLRERREDIPALVDHFVRFFQTALGRKGLVLSREAIDALMGFSWPGNVRQLRNVIERALVMNQDKKVIGKRHLQLPDEEPGACPGENEVLPLAEVEKRHILARLKHCGGNQSKAARLLGVSKITLWRKLKEYGVAPKSLQT